MSLRERQRLNRHNAILNSARKLFKEHTYAKTTMNSIAEEAEVGIATLYNYFGTKEGVLAEIAKEDFKLINIQCELVVKNPPIDPTEAIQSLFQPYDKSRKLASAEMISTYLTGAKQGDGPLRDTALQADKTMKTQVKTILNKAKAGGQLADDLPVNEATDIILILFNQFYYRAFGSERKQAASAFKKLIKLIALVFRQWQIDSSLH